MGGRAGGEKGKLLFVVSKIDFILSVKVRSCCQLLLVGVQKFSTQFLTIFLTCHLSFVSNRVVDPLPPKKANKAISKLIKHSSNFTVSLKNMD